MTIDELRERQGWTLEQKIDHSVGTIETFISRISPAGVYVSFSGGKDSTVLLDLARRFVDKNIPAVFCNTGNEWPELIRFVRKTENVVFIHPHVSIKQIYEEKGFPLVSKEVSNMIWRLRHQHSEAQRRKFLAPKRTDHDHALAKKWRYLVDAPFDCSQVCCDFLKKKPFKEYDKQTNSRGIIATLAEESRLRTLVYLKRGGCNSFNKYKTASYPLSIWTENDIYKYISKYSIKLCHLYYEGFERTGCMACGFGLQYDNGRLDNLKRLQPRLYDKFMSYTNNGVTYKEALRYAGCNPP